MRISPISALLLMLTIASAAAEISYVNRSACEYATELDPKIRGCTATLAEVFQIRGTAYLQKNELDRAIRDFDESISLNPKSNLAFITRGMAYVRKGEIDSGIRDYDKAISLNPKSAAAFNNRGDAYLQKGELDRALRDAEEAIRLDPKLAYAFATRGETYLQKGLLDDAIRDLEKAVSLDPKSAVILSSRGDVWMARKDPTKALADYVAALNLDGSYDKAQRGRERAVAAFVAANSPAARPPSSAPTPQAPRLPGNRHALVFGIDSYRHLPSLNTARNDARAVSATLKELGFETLEATDTDRSTMGERIVDFEGRIKAGDSVFFFFAGHAIAYQGRNWLLPADMSEIAPGREGRLEDLAYAADGLLDRFKRRGARLNVMVLDAYRDNPFVRKGTTRSAFVGARGLERMSMPDGTFIFYSAAENERALDRLPGESHPNSVFTRVLVEELKRPGRRLVDIALETQRRVSELARKAGMVQGPAYYDNFAGSYALK